MPFPSPGDLPNPGIEPESPALQVDSLPSEPPGKPNTSKRVHNSSTLKQKGIKIENICGKNFSLHEETPQTNSDSKTIS